MVRVLNLQSSVYSLQASAKFPQFPGNRRGVGTEKNAPTDIGKRLSQAAAIPVGIAQKHVSIRTLAIAIHLPVLGCQRVDIKRVDNR